MFGVFLHDEKTCRKFAELLGIEFDFPTEIFNTELCYECSVGFYRETCTFRIYVKEFFPHLCNENAWLYIPSSFIETAGK